MPINRKNHRNPPIKGRFHPGAISKASKSYKSTQTSPTRDRHTGKWINN